MDGNPSVMLVPIADCRSWRFRALNPDRHPLVDAARRLLAGDRNGAEEGLRAWYAANVVNTAADLFEPTPVASDIADEPAWAIPLPWWGETIEHRRRQAERNARVEYSLPDLRSEEVSQYWNAAGPVAAEVPAWETERLLRIIESGFQHDQEPDLPRVRGLIAPGESVKWEIKSGHHRFAVDAARGLRFRRVVLIEFVRLDEAATWTGVTSGHFSLEAAQDVFQRVIRGTK